ncbi:uncharacterized protein LOC106164250 [Lingula anatina]|uniref:Uncharacterized protein LOC106164250 n=1 Tax=Lingula anatina TaxID=7574 RepID=A0A1S3IH64_LINAN|nr:uncharacterized protein LOC106164250 [Lingula anatina]|eukprot:XP_013397557.2 uncharacterized protein LOC106164250 [Lingula anatina]
MSHPAIDNHSNGILIYLTTDSGQVPGVSTRIRENESDQASYSRQRSSDSGVSQLSTGGESVRSVTPIAAPGRENKKNPDKDLEKLQGDVKKLRLCIRKLVIVFVVITCLLISAVVAVGVHSFHPYVNTAEHSVNAEQAGVADDTLSSLCIPCADLSQDVSVEELRMEKNPDLCCARNQTQFHKLLQWYVDVKIQQAEEGEGTTSALKTNFGAGFNAKCLS